MKFEKNCRNSDLPKMLFRPPKLRVLHIFGTADCVDQDLQRDQRDYYIVMPQQHAMVVYMEREKK
jgi:hypothetical protein